jgi:hypothetical protein
MAPENRQLDVFPISVKLRLAAVVAAACALALATYFLTPMVVTISDLAKWREDAKFVLTVIAGGIAVYSAWYASLSFRFNVQKEEEGRQEGTRRESEHLRRDRCRASFERLEALNHVDKVAVRCLIEEINDKKLSKDQVYDYVVQKQDLWRGVVGLLGGLEDLAIAVKSEMVDERILYDSLRFIVVNTSDKLTGYIEVLRDRARSPKLYVEMQELANQWRAGKSLHGGERWQ